MSFNESIICDRLKSMNIAFESKNIMGLNFKEKKVLRELLQKYKDVIKNKKKYINVENIDNESKSDDDFSDEAYEDEREEDDEEEDEEEKSSSDPDEQSCSEESSGGSSENSESQQESEENRDGHTYSPSLGDIEKGSCRSFDSKQIKNLAIKYDPKILKHKKIESGSIKSQIVLDPKGRKSSFKTSILKDQELRGERVSAGRTDSSTWNAITTTTSK